MENKDIKLGDVIQNNSVDLKFRNGDFIITDSLAQDIGLILKYGTGHLRQFVDLGVHIDLFNNGTWTQELKNKIRQELKKDGIQVKAIKLINNEIKIEL